MGDQRHSSNDRVIADGHTLENHDATTDPDIVTDRDRANWKTRVSPEQGLHIMKVSIVNHDVVPNQAIVANDYLPDTSNDSVIIKNVSGPNSNLGFGCPRLDKHLPVAQPLRKRISESIVSSYHNLALAMATDRNLKPRAEPDTDLPMSQRVDMNEVP